MVEADVVAPAKADIVAPVAASVEAKTIASIEVNAHAPVEARAAALDTIPHAEPEATTETLVHPQDVDLGIPHQEATSAYVRLSSSHF